MPNSSIDSYKMLPKRRFNEGVCGSVIAWLAGDGAERSKVII
ncbi:hypothetical protein CAter282_3211 [Collimonas arenae]|uniref:Uncharacterized protein n=1 Tax=Collimonas arenae TaxID=279058 RepID=A0A127PTS1_9BURK|nr:hypothetical protein CAter10_3521 [Collimonas arenae]AMP10917.1 hypothetical protein CAter282_3211 [Collimonas arenae]